MKAKKTFLAVASIFIVFNICFGQQRVYTNYNVKDGLPSSMVYTVVQDKKGFIWFGTDRGMSRYDGTNFTNYTVADGLPDNDVFIIAEDSIGRLWVICYNSRPCYIQNGIIHNADNDTLLRSIDEGEMWLTNIYIDKDGKVWLLGDKIYTIEGNRLTTTNTPGNKRCSGMGYIGNKLSIVISGGVYYISGYGKKVTYQKICTIGDNFHHTPAYWNNDAYIVENEASNSTRIIKVTPDTFYISNINELGIDNIIENFTAIIGDSLLLVSQRGKGIKAFNRALKLMKEPFSFLPDLTYTHFTIDSEGNIWASTLEQGVFFISHIGAYQYSDLIGNKTEISAVYKSREKLVLGLDHSTYGTLENNSLKITSIKSYSSAGKKMTKLCNLNDSTLVAGTDYGLFTISTKDFSYRIAQKFLCIKDMWHEGNDSVLVASTEGIYRLYLRKGNFHLESLSTNRTTSVTQAPDGTIWYSTLNGLYFMKGNRIERYKSDSLLVQSRITDIVCDHTGRLWIATHQRGLFVVTPIGIVNINEKNGLPSDLCARLIYKGDSTIWACVNHNIAQINVTGDIPFTYNLKTLNGFSQGLGIRIHDIYLDTDDIFLASSQGLFRISNDALTLRNEPPVYITSFTCNNVSYTDYVSLKLKHQENNIEIKFVGISYNNTAKMLYKYIVDGTGGDTIFTYNNTIDFYALPPGKYFFSVWARNPQGIWSSSPAHVMFEILPPIWMRWWFLVSASAAAVLLIWVATRWRIRSIRRQEMEKTILNKKIAEVELQAVRSHMNEHFVFNSLNSIQNFINKNDIEAANFYLASFGKLIRKTMDISSVHAISLREEMDYLHNYLTLEKMRFGKKFDYTLTNNISNFSAEDITLPSMVLQPYVENAIRHGLRHKVDGMGLLQIVFSVKGDLLVCKIQDNGIGRKKSAEIKSFAHIEYSSKGMRLSEDKVNLFNKLNNSKVDVELQDLQDALGHATGTLVIITIPIYD